MNQIQKGICIASAASLSLLSASALDQASTVDDASLKAALSAAPNAELPAFTADLVVKAQGKDREKTAESIVAMAVEMNPVSAASIVAAACKLSPDLSPVIATSAANHQPKQIDAIARAAVMAAPSQALNILAQLCKRHPTLYREVAVTIAQAMPGMDRSILNTLADAVPSIRVFLTRAYESIGKVKDLNPSVPVVIAQISADISKTASSLNTPADTLVNSGVSPVQLAALPPSPPAPQPQFRPPFTPFDDKNNNRPREYNITRTTPVTGGRDYSSP